MFQLRAISWCHMGIPQKQCKGQERPWCRRTRWENPTLQWRNCNLCPDKNGVSGKNWTQVGLKIEVEPVVINLVPKKVATDTPFPSQWLSASWNLWFPALPSPAIPSFCPGEESKKLCSVFHSLSPWNDYDSYRNTPEMLIQWIGLRENLQETTAFTIKLVGLSG